jgi:CheY-like chemotaxis protein/HPt (histidine-containing phosphotransfer) domain-containing protein
VNQKVALRALKTLGVEAHLVSDGAQALSIARERAFDLIFMDCQMPVMDGYEATGAIRTFSEVPIVAMTANALTGDRERCLAAGMSDYMTKPLKLDAVAAMLARWLPGLTDDASVPQAIGTPVAPINTSGPALDAEIVEQIATLTGDGFVDLIRTYLSDTAHQLESIESALAHGERGVLERSAHSLKSSSSSLGVISMSHIAEALESHARNSGTLEVAQRMLAALQAAYSVVRPDLERIATRAGMVEGPESSGSGRQGQFVKERAGVAEERRS